MAATELNLPAGVRLIMTLAGGLLLAAFFYRMGRELMGWTSPERSRLRTVIKVIVWPVVLGTALVIVAFLPMPPAFYSGLDRKHVILVFRGNRSGSRTEARFADQSSRSAGAAD